MLKGFWWVLGLIRRVTVLTCKPERGLITLPVTTHEPKYSRFKL